MTSVLRYSKMSLEDLDSAWWHRLAQFNPDLHPEDIRVHSPKHSYPWYVPRYLAEHRFFLRPFHRMNHIPPWRMVTQTDDDAKASDEIGVSLQDPVFQREMAEMSREERNAFIEKLKVESPMEMHSTTIRDMIQERFFNDHLQRADSTFGVGESIFSPTFMWDEWGERVLTESDRDHVEKQFHTWLDKEWSGRNEMHYLVDEDEFQAQAGAWFAVRAFAKLCLKDDLTAKDLNERLLKICEASKSVELIRAGLEKVRSGAITVDNIPYAEPLLQINPTLGPVLEAAKEYEAAVEALAAKLKQVRDSTNAGDDKVVETIRQELPESVRSSLDADMLGDDGLAAVAEFAYTLNSFVKEPLKKAQAYADQQAADFAAELGMTVEAVQALSEVAIFKLTEVGESVADRFDDEPRAGDHGSVLTADLSVKDPIAFMISNTAQQIHVESGARQGIVEHKEPLLKVFRGVVSEKDQAVRDYLLRASRGLNNTHPDNPKAWWHTTNELQPQWSYLDDEWTPYLERLNLGPLSRKMLREYHHLKALPMPVRHYVGQFSMQRELYRLFTRNARHARGHTANRTWNVTLFGAVILSLAPFMNSQMRYSGKIFHDSFLDVWHPCEFSMPWYRVICLL